MCLCWLTLSLWAQTGVNELSPSPDDDCFESLDGNRGVLILSKHKDLIIDVTNKAYPVSVDLKGKNTDGWYRYYVIINVNDTQQPKLEVGRMGSPYRSSLLVTLKNPDYLVAYRLEEVENPIRYDEQTEVNDVHFNATEAALRFTSTLKSLTVKCPPELGARITSRVNPQDTSLIAIEVIIPLAKLDEARTDVTTLRTRLDKLNALLDAGKLATDAPEWDEMDSLEEEVKRAEAHLTSLSSVMVYGRGTNLLSIPIGDLGPRMEKNYVVLPIVIEKEVFTSQCNALIDEGGRLFGMRKYKQARAAYGKALQTGEPVVHELKPNIQAAMALCDSCVHYDDLTARCLRQIARMKEEGHATQAQVAEYASYAIQYIEQIYKFNPDEYYLKRIELMQRLLLSMNLQMKFTFVEWKTFSEGRPIPGVKVWIYRGFTPLSSNSFSSDKRFRRMLKKEPMNFEQVGRSGADGIAEVELDRTKLPTGILFYPGEDAPQKIVYMTLEDLMRQAQGTYMKKQYRVKMFTK